MIETLTNDDKIRLLNMALNYEGPKDYKDLYKSMVDIVVNYKPETKKD